MSESTEPRNFVYLGQRYSSDGHRYVAVAVLNAAGDTIEKEQHYSFKKAYEYAIGCVYAGAEFGDKNCVGLDCGSFREEWKDTGRVIEWKAKDEEARARVALAKREQDAKGSTELESIMAPLQRVYARMNARGDHLGCSALEQAVVRMLRRKPKQP